MHASTVLVAALLSLAVSAAVAYAISQRPVRPGHRGCVAAAWVLLFFFEIIVLSWPKPGGWHSCEYQLFMVVVLSYVCCCWNSSADNTSSEARDVEMDQMDLAPKPDGADAAVDAAAPTSAPGTTRLHYLDNLKAFLTAMVVVSYVAGAFGGLVYNEPCAADGLSSTLIVGGLPAAFANMIPLMNLYLGALFFFVCAYFVPASYARAGGWRGFQAAKRRRLLYPALFLWIVVNPMCGLIGGSKKGPYIGHTWFSWWLLLFNLAYASFPARESTNEELAEPLADRRAPHAAATTADGPCLLFNPCFRRTVGPICGLSMMVWWTFFYKANYYSGFAMMPFPMLAIVYILMYYLGVQAANGRSLERPLIPQLELAGTRGAAGWHTILVVVEGITILVAVNQMMYFLPGVLYPSLLADKPYWQEYTKGRFLGWSLVFLCAAGMYCFDMSLLVLVAFQRWANVETSLTHFLARGAYGAYLLHPFVVTAVTRCFLFMSGDNAKSTLGFIFVAVLSLAITWPVAYSLAQLPVLKTIL